MNGQTLPVQAELLDEQVPFEAPAGWRVAASAPLLLEAPGGGYAALFRYGPVVFFGVSEDDKRVLRKGITRRRTGEPFYEDARIEVEPGVEARSEAGTIRLPDLKVEHLQLVAEVLARSVALEGYEHAIAASFETIEPLARKLHRAHHPGRKARALLAHIGDALLAEQKMTARVEVRDKPDLLWDRPELERFYLRLEDEYEVQERAAELERKLELTSRTARTALELLQYQRTLRVEWYIVLLILVEIGLTTYELWFH